MSQRFKKLALPLVTVVAIIAVPLFAIYIADGAAVALAPGLDDPL